MIHYINLAHYVPKVKAASRTFRDAALTTANSYFMTTIFLVFTYSPASRR